jgi:hypothetical protein
MESRISQKIADPIEPEHLRGQERRGSKIIIMANRKRFSTDNSSKNRGSRSIEKERKFCFSPLRMQ